MEFLHKNSELFLQAINIASSEKNILPEIIEKDYLYNLKDFEVKNFETPNKDEQ